MGRERPGGKEVRSIGAGRGKMWEPEVSCPSFIQRLQNDNPQGESSLSNVLFNNTIFSMFLTLVFKKHILYKIPKFPASLTNQKIR